MPSRSDLGEIIARRWDSAHREGQSLPCSLLAAEVLHGPRAMKVIPCVLQPNSSTTEQQSMLAARAREGQRDRAHPPGWDTRRTSPTLDFTANSSPWVGKERLGYSPSGGRLHHVERAGGDRYLKPPLQNKAAPVETGAAKRVVCRPAACILWATFRGLSGALSHFLGR